MGKRIIDIYLEMLDYNKMPNIFKKYLLSPSLLRLKNVGYFCGMDFASKDVYNFKEKVSRYDHSLCVALLTWKLTHDVKNTLAALFHDVSTPCFSHVIDYMNKDYDKQESTEEKTEEIIRNDRYLLKCLEEDNILVDEIIDFKRYSIVDLDRPMLCADRLDGVILNGLLWSESLAIDDVKNIIDDLMVVTNEYGKLEISFKTKEVAKIVLCTSELIDMYCHSNEDNYMMELLSKITKRAIDLGLLLYDDLFLLDEDEVFKIIEESDDNILKCDMELFKNILISDIPRIEIPCVKVRKLEPIVLGVRLKKV